MVTWSYSSIKTFDQCPKKYYHLKVLKDIKDEGSEATVYGEEVHKAAEDYVKHGTPIPAKYEYMEPIVSSLIKSAGEKYAELKLGMRKTDTGFEPCDFFDKDVWWRGIIDLAVVNDTKGRLVDYKTGKNTKYADMRQLDLCASAMFLHFPQLTSIKSALAYVVANEFIVKDHKVEEFDTYINVFETQLDRLGVAQDTGVWNASPSGLCGWCPVKACEHFREPRKWKR
jgi:hypothetical protein